MKLIPEGWFENDGCTLWFDNWFGVRTTQCCDVHDQAFNHGHTLVQFFQANFDLMVCGFQIGVPGWAILAFCGATLGGAVPFFTGNKAKDVKVVTVYDPTQGNNSLRDGTGPGETGSSSEDK